MGLHVEVVSVLHQLSLTLWSLKLMKLLAVVAVLLVGISTASILSAGNNVAALLNF